MPNRNIAVVDAGAGNLHSVLRALRYAAPEADIRLCQTPAQIVAASRLVLPGQGAFRDCMQQLQTAGLVEAICEAARSKPLLGVCVGLQLLFESSEEAPGVPGLGLLAGDVIRFSGPAFGSSHLDPAALKVPHMGWNQVRQVQNHPLWQGVPDPSYFYFVHSYHVRPAQAAISAGMCHYGVDFTCAVAADNIFATQFHPEKSASAGLQIYRNFMHWQP